MLSSLFLTATLAVGIDPSSASSGANLPVVTTKQSITAKQKLAEKVALQRPFHELDRQIVATLTQEALLAKQKDEPARAKSAVQLCDLHREVVGDTRFATSEVLQAYQSKLSSRLVRVKKDIQAKLAKEAKRPISEEAKAQAAVQSIANESYATSLLLSDYAVGSPNLLLAHGGSAVIDANGQALVDLIETTIDPESWSTNGGPGTIRYYAPLQCLVIRATGEVHENVGGALGDLRK